MGDSFGIPLDVVNGLVRCVHPGIDNHVSFGAVLAVDYDALLEQSYIDVEDLEGRLLNAIEEYGCDPMQWEALTPRTTARDAKPELLHPGQSATAAAIHRPR